MFGHRFFGARFYAPRYFGDGGTGVPVSPPPPPPSEGAGGWIVPHTFTRKRWKELQDAIRAEEEARDKAEGLKKAKERKPLIVAVQAAAQAIEVAQEGDSANLAKMADALEAASRAKSLSTRIAEAKLAVSYARAILQQMDDEEEEAIMLLMLH